MEALHTTLDNRLNLGTKRSTASTTVDTVHRLSTPGTDPDPPAQQYRIFHPHGVTAPPHRWTKTTG